MDVFAHALWTGALFRAINIKAKKKISVWKGLLWGIAPDVFSFGLLTAWMLLSLIFGGTTLDFQHFEAMEPAQRDTIPIFQIVSFMYNITHSIFIFGAVFIMLWFVFRKPLWATLGWLIHILIDIPTHSYQFYPTPFLWPISGWKFNGISWGQRWFMIANYSAILITYICLYLWSKKQAKKPKQ
ncbi:MAG TPA: hypothetical protein HA362_05810 [Nanoarchaeota archaeon]|nr:hypothetical protein [Nanoarchaeota archaeon]